ncbi:cysteine--tRNA ligase [Paraurantiacibacter namhicola]|uniref:Cysteine--tRNA ligase n=1 Tax=Paraurantiacibacter namhicola TaxID=645517 RepID=A0A1C7DAK4_9SPHN|nr:cysteine--tRNA ligase [Paraurantiacibacter namhicola]ANU08333.1 Cysteine--tRNA ligase [Paraurantiacibacter namhicola]
MTNLRLFNSLTRQVEDFRPVHDGEARVYTCGPTVYNYPHIGNMRAYVFADILGRTLSWKGYKLTHVINITDVGHLTDDADSGEDKMEKMAAEKAQSIWDIARHYTEAYWADVKALNIRQPAEWSVATDYIAEMIDFAKSIAGRHCYELESGLYFDVSTVEDYGRLARAVTEDGEGRIGAVNGKRNPQDFAIWRKTPAGETRQMEWDSPWGKGAPGWHLECSVMSGKLLGFPFDIHTGGIDHREIHHPNEIAQNQAFCGCGGLGEVANSGARVWMHNNFLVERSGKMSKSSGEFLRLQLLIDKGYHPLAYRMMCLQAHYRSELEFSWDGLEAALVRLKRMVMQAERLRDVETGTPDHPKFTALLEKFDAAIGDDLGTPIALTALEEALAVKKVDAGIKRSVVERMDSVLGLGLLELKREDLRIRPKSATTTEAEIEDALARRKAARAEKDFATSDALRDELAAMGVEVMDGDPLGWEWKLG